LAKKEKRTNEDKETIPSLDSFERRLYQLNDRLDNIDSILTAVAERLMNQLIIIGVNCPYCGGNVKITLVGRVKPAL